MFDILRWSDDYVLRQRVVRGGVGCAPAGLQLVSSTSSATQRVPRGPTLINGSSSSHPLCRFSKLLFVISQKIFFFTIDGFLRAIIIIDGKVYITTILRISEEDEKKRIR